MGVGGEGAEYIAGSGPRLLNSIDPSNWVPITTLESIDRNVPNKQKPDRPLVNNEAVFVYKYTRKVRTS